jgi:hypothetical protein
MQGGVNSGAQQQEQNNQAMGEKYAAKQMAEAQAALAAWQKANPSPANAGATGPQITGPPGASGAITPPGGAPPSPGGTPAPQAAPAGQPQAQPQAQGQRPPMQGQPQQQIPPQMRAQLMAMLQGQAR